LPDRARPASDVERGFVAAFGAELEAEELASGLYLPLKDEEGMLGVLLFEAKRPGFASETQRELAEILANQTTVALRNAQLYNQVPLVDALGAPSLQRRAAEWRAEREAAAAEAAAAERSAAVAASRGNPAEERLQRTRAQAFRREVALLDDEVGSTTVRAPVSGMVLTPRPEERLGARLEAGDLAVTLG